MTSSTLRLSTILRNPNCTLCPLYQDAQHVCLIGVGPYPTDLLFVGEAPGFREDRNVHTPFQGKAGKLLDSILYAFDIQRDKVYITNAVKCRPVENGKNTKPPKSSIRVCSQKYLTEEVKRVKPRLIVALGKIAIQALIDEGLSVNAARNKVWKTKKPYVPDIPIIVTYHPAAALRNDHLTARITEDMEWVMDYLEHGDAKENVIYQKINSLEEAPELSHARWLSVDLETDGLDPYLSERFIISIQLAARPGFAYYLDWNDDVRRQVKPILENPDVGKIGHNLGKFDRQWLWKAGINLRGPIHDTLLQIHLLDENFPDKSLGAVSAAFTPLKGHKDEMATYIRKHKCTFRDVPPEIAVPYGCGDVDAALRVAKIFTPRLKKEGLIPLYKMQMAAQNLAAEVERDGIKVRVDLFDELEDYYRKSIRINEKKLRKLARKEMNPNSWKQVGDLLYEEWNLPAVGDPIKWGGPPTKNTAEITLLRLIDYMNGEDGDFSRQINTINKIMELRAEKKLLSTYIIGMGDYVREGELIHSNFLLHGTVTGRWSSRDPNLQNIPREGEIKRLFVSRYGSHGVIMSVDVSQGELRWAAHRSGERNLISAFHAGTTDIHRSVAATVFGIPEKEVSKEQRKKAKTVNFGILYGAGKHKMATQMGCSLQEAQDFIRQWHANFPDWDSFESAQRRRVLRDGLVRNSFGRIRHLPIIDENSPQGKEALRQGINSPIQGDLADFTVRSGVEVKSYFKISGLRRTHFVAQVHDQWLLDVHEDEIQVVSSLFKENMIGYPDLSEFGFKLLVPMDIEISTGPSWKEQIPIYPVLKEGA